jgi:hypothetical protein
MSYTHTHFNYFYKINILSQPVTVHFQFKFFLFHMLNRNSGRTRHAMYTYPLLPMKGKKDSILQVCVCILVWVISRTNHNLSVLYLLPSLSCLALPHFSTPSHKWHMFRKNLLGIKCVFWVSLQLFSQIYLILRRIQEDIINWHRSTCKVPIITVRF